MEDKYMTYHNLPGTISAGSTWVVSVFVNNKKIASSIILSLSVTYATSASVGLVIYPYEGLQANNSTFPYTPTTISATVSFVAGGTVYQTFIFPVIGQTTSFAIVNQDKTYSAVINYIYITVI